MKHTSIPFWSWNDELKKEKLNKQIDWMNKNGFGGFVMHARFGLKTEYLGREWFDSIRFCCKKAKELEMTAWAYDENGWPSGFVGGKLLENDEFKEHFLSCTIGAYDKKAFLHYDLDIEELHITDNINAINCLNIFDNVSNSSVDILDDKVVDEFIKNTHERYNQEISNLSDNIEGFFTDEPQYSCMGIPFPHRLKNYFYNTYGQDPIPLLVYLFVKKDGYREFRYRFWKSCQQLMLNNFARKIYDWCESHNVKLIGHYIEERDLFSQMLFNAGIMPFYDICIIRGLTGFAVAI